MTWMVNHAWHTVGRAALAVGVPLARLGLRVPCVRDQATLRRAVETGEMFTGERASTVGGDPEQLSREQVAVSAEQLQGLDPRRLAGSITAFASATTAMFVDQQSMLQLLDRVMVPVLLLWGTDGPLIDQPVSPAPRAAAGLDPSPVRRSRTPPARRTTRRVCRGGPGFDGEHIAMTVARSPRIVCAAGSPQRPA